MHQKPTLSIITVTYNAGDVLTKTIKSIINQTFDNYEFIIIDGKSRDNTLEIISQYTNHITHFISEEDNGIYDAMNKGMSLANGEYIQFLNAGDYYCDNNVLSDIFTSFTISSKPTLIYGDINILHTNGKISYQKAGSFTLEELLRRGTGVLCHQAMFVRKSKAPLYDCKYRFKAELNWYFDIVESKDLTKNHIPRTVVDYSLGGFGHKHFLSNRIEWISLIFHRYGLKTLYKSRIIIFLLKNSLSRYPILYNSVNFIKQTGRIFK